LIPTKASIPGDMRKMNPTGLLYTSNGSSIYRLYMQLTPIEETILPSTVTDADVTRCTTILMEIPNGWMLDSNQKI
jgi:hypothetical protein